MTDNYDAIDYWTNIFTPQGLDRMYMQNDELSAIVKWWSMDERLKGYEPEAFVRMLDENRIRKTFVPSFKMWSYRKRAPLLSIEVSEIYALMQACPGRVGGMFGVDVTKGMAAVRELETAVRELGLRGLNLQCFELKLAINDKRMYPLYAKCVELSIPVNIHCGINFSTASQMDYGRPAYLDEVMLHFPELRVCASPPGWPWIEELIGVAWRHPNVYIGVVAVRPKLLALEDSGYRPLLTYGTKVLQDKILTGTAYPMQSVEQAYAEFDALPLPDAIRRKWMHDNSARFLGLD